MKTTKHRWDERQMMVCRLAKRLPNRERRAATRSELLRFFIKGAFLLISLWVSCGFGVAAAGSDAALPSRESIEWCDIWISHANETNLPRVLLIGDSIARDYYPEVEKRLAGKAFVGRLATSRFVADLVLLKEIETVLSGTKFDVIQFNNGMHGWQHSEEEYRKAFPKLIKTIRAHAPNATVLWATTTPLRNGKDVTGDKKVEYSDDRIAARNTIVAEFLAKNKIS